MSTQEVLHEPNGAPLMLLEREINPVVLVQQAMEKNLPPEALKSVVDFVERVDALNARKAFVHAMNIFKQNPPTITKNKHVEFGNTKYNHATLDHVCEEITRALSAVGISHRWAISQTEGKIRVACVLTHKLGHSEEAALEGPADASGSKNAIQAIGSSVTYLQRYTLLSAAGLAVQGQDDDGQGSGPKYDELPEALDYIANSRNLDELQQQFSAGYKAAKKIGDVNAMKRIIAAKDERKRELA